MEYGALTWMSSAATHVQILDAVQQCALQQVDSDEHQQSAHITSLEQQHNELALVVYHKAGSPTSRLAETCSSPRPEVDQICIDK